MTTAPALTRDMSSFGGLLITISALSPSVGVFIVGNDVLRQVGSGAFLCFVAAVLLGIAMSAIYAELSSAFPNAGGEYTVASHVLGPLAGFAMLATNLAGDCIALATLGLGVAEYLQPLRPGLPIVPTAMACIAAVTLTAVLSINVNAWITGIFLGVEILTLMATAALGFSHAHTAGAALMLHPVAASAGVLHPIAGVALGVAASSGIYAFNGYGSVIFLGEEIRDARRRIGRVVYASLAVAAFTELLPLAGIIAGAPNFAALSESSSPVPDFFRALGGPALSRVLSAAVAAAIFNTMIAVALTGARQIFASGRDQCWPRPVNRFLLHIHPRFGSPWTATLLLGAAALACCLVPTHVLLIVIGNGNVAIYATLAVAVIAGRKNGSTRLSLSKAPLHPLAPAIVLIALAGIVWADLLDPVAGRAGLAAEALIFAAGATYYARILRPKGSWTLTAPPDG